MKRCGVLGLSALTALCLSSIIATSSAGAEEYAPHAVPEIGRCVLVGLNNGGEWVGAKCQQLNTTRGKYQWLPGPGPKPKFTSSGEAASLETVGGARHKIECAASNLEGEYTGPKTATVKVVLIGCLLLETNQQCSTNPAKSGEIEGSGEGAVLNFIRGGTKPIAGWDINVSGGSMTYTCGKPPETSVTTGSVEGSVIAPVTPMAKMTTEMTLKYKVISGKQVPENFEGEPKDTLTTKFVHLPETFTEQTGLRTKVLLENEEPLEIKVKCVGAGC